jgi:hypothetical protein
LRNANDAIFEGACVQFGHKLVDTLHSLQEVMGFYMKLGFTNIRYSQLPLETLQLLESSKDEHEGNLDYMIYNVSTFRYENIVNNSMQGDLAGRYRLANTYFYSTGQQNEINRVFKQLLTASMQKNSQLTS